MNIYQSEIKEWIELLSCPYCHTGRLDYDGDHLRCLSCQKNFPLVDGIPVVINEDASVFSTADYSDYRPTTYTRSRLLERVERFLPRPMLNNGAKRRYERIKEILEPVATKPMILVLGGAILGEGVKSLLEGNEAVIVESDVSFGPRTRLICDAHDIPFQDGTVDAVIVQAVLEHVVDPWRCAAEIWRVLKPSGLVYAETPFMQQVHAGRYDFTRFTHLGHRRLFRHFAEITSGPIAGPGTVLAWSYEHFWLSWATSHRGWYCLKGFARLTGAWLKLLDLILPDRPGLMDCASGYYFLGRKSESPISDRKLVASYRGVQP